MQSPTSSPTSWSDPTSTLALEAHHHSPATPSNVLLMCMHPPPSPARLHHIWTRLSIPAIPAPRAVWPTTGPKGHPSGWLVHPLSAHHHLPSPSSTPCMHAVGGIIIHHMIHLWSPVPGPECILITILNLAFISLCKTWK